MSNSGDNNQKNISINGLPIRSLIFMIVGAIGGYLGGETFLVSWSHPLHWVAGAVSAIVAFLVYMFFYERYGASL
jgi:Mg2+ and Co2+ transporter CorA